MLFWYALIGVFIWGLFDIACGIGILMRLLFIPLGWLTGWSRKPTFGYRDFRPKLPLKARERRDTPNGKEVDEHGVPWL